MTNDYNRDASKKATSVSIEQALEESLKRQRRERWLAENRSAINGYNEDVAKHGVFSEGLKSF